jgi:hypothetical protein
MVAKDPRVVRLENEIGDLTRQREATTDQTEKARLLEEIMARRQRITEIDRETVEDIRDTVVGAAKALDKVSDRTRNDAASAVGRQVRKRTRKP